MIFDISAKPLLDQLIAASSMEFEATNALLVALEGGVRDNATLELLTKNMTETHNAKMTIWNQLAQTQVA